MVTASQRRAAASHLAEHYEVSQRRVCPALGCSRSSLRYQPRDRPDEETLARAILAEAREHPRWGWAHCW